MMVANILVPLVYNFVLIYINVESIRTGTSPADEIGSFMYWAYNVSHDLVGVLQLVSGIFLLVAVSKIRSFLLKAGMRN